MERTVDLAWLPWGLSGDQRGLTLIEITAIEG